jgi:predicted kinase
MITAHLVTGNVGAGKTTYSIALAERLGAVRFSIDEWMTALFWMDTPQPLDPAWSMQRFGRCLTQIWAVTLRVAARGVPCVLDIGFGQTQSRAKIAPTQLRCQPRNVRFCRKSLAAAD